jgi:hypothetical protein
MKKTNIKTFRVLLIKDKMRARELAELVEVNGTHCKSSNECGPKF